MDAYRRPREKFVVQGQESGGEGSEGERKKKTPSWLVAIRASGGTRWHKRVYFSEKNKRPQLKEGKAEIGGGLSHSQDIPIVRDLGANVYEERGGRRRTFLWNGLTSAGTRGRPKGTLHRNQKPTRASGSWELG